METSQIEAASDSIHLDHRISERYCTNEGGAESIETLREVYATVSRLLDHAMSAFEQRDYAACSRLCQNMLLILRDYPVATQLMAEVQKAAGRPDYRSQIQSHFEEWRIWVRDEEPVLPDATKCDYPSRKEWQELLRRNPGWFIPSRVALSGDELDLHQWIASLNAMRVPVRLAGRPEGLGRATLHTSEISWEHALDLIAARFGLTWRRTGDSEIVLEPYP